jgi:hypothetical protein
VQYICCFATAYPGHLGSDNGLDAHRVEDRLASMVLITFVELVVLAVLMPSIVIAIAVDLLIKVVVEVVSIKADVPDVVCALTEQLPKPAIKKAMNKILSFIYFG